MSEQERQIIKDGITKFVISDPSNGELHGLVVHTDEWDKSMCSN